MKQSLMDSWKYIDSAEKRLQDEKRGLAISRNKSSEIVPEASRPKEDDNIYPTSTTIATINLSIKKKPTSSSQFKRRPAEFSDEIETKYSKPIRWSPNPEIFKPNVTNFFKSTFLPGTEVLDSEIKVLCKIPVCLDLNLEALETTVTYFETFVSAEIKEKATERKLRLNPTPSQIHDDKLYNKVIILRSKFRQAKDQMTRNLDNTFTVGFKNQVSGDLLYKFRELGDSRINLDMKIIDYSSLMKPSEIKRLFDIKNFDTQLTTYMNKIPMSYSPSLGMYYALNGNEDDKYKSWSLDVLTICEDLSKLHLVVQNKTIL
jgi:hypothetical protein